MRILVVADSDERRAWLQSLVARAPHDVVATSSVRLLSALATSEPDWVFFDAVEDPERARRDLDRARGSIEAHARLLLVVSAGSTWRHVLPRDLSPAIAMTEADVVAALELPGSDGASRRARRVDEQPRAVVWQQEAREVRGPEGSVVLTASESAIVDLLMRQAGSVVPANVVSRALWGDVILDGHGRAAIRTHIYELRRKLRAIGLGQALVSAPGWGYRLEVSG